MVLTRLRSGPTRRTWSVDDLRRGIAGYEEGASGDRNWHYDSEALRARGLIKTGISLPHTPRRTGVQYGLTEKDPDLHLSAEEHAALAAARRARGTTEVPSPFAGAARGGQAVTAAKALRRIEEHGDWVTVGELAREMNERPARLLKTLSMVWCLDVDGRTVFDDSVLMIDDGGGDLPPGQVRICFAPGGSPDRPLLDTGLALIGLGAYTLEETAERLDLIADVLAGHLPGDAEVLASAGRKLERWQQILRAARR